MVCSYPAKFLITLFLLSFAKGVFGAIFHWIFTKDTFDINAPGFPDEIRNNIDGLL